MTYQVLSNGEVITIGKNESLKGYAPENILKGQNGMIYYPVNMAGDDIIHIVSGNSKTGEEVLNFNLPIELTCDHRCECYRDKKCYACSGCYLYGNNQYAYTQNYNFIKSERYCFEDVLAIFQRAIDETGAKLFRFFTCGDIPNKRFFRLMVELAYNNPNVKFWSYTKKYYIVNDYITHWYDEETKTFEFPNNLAIVFSHWMNDDQTYFPMNNPYNMPTSEFIPLGKEELKDSVTHICPCSDPSMNVTCATCDHPCYTLKQGESMALLEHSTGRTRKRDKAIKAAKKALKGAK